MFYFDLSLFFYSQKFIFLILTIFFPLLGAILLFFIPFYKINLIKIYSLFFSSLSFVSSLFLWFLFDPFIFDFQFCYFFDLFLFKNVQYSLGIDGLSLFFVILTTFLFPICILVSYKNYKYSFKSYVFLLLLTEFFLLNIFCVLDLVFFYIFFESVLIPMFLLIGIWGSRDRKIHAAYQFFIYTLLGSVFMLIGILVIYSHLGTTDFFIFLSSTFNFSRQIILWLAFFISFSVKIPMLPVHIWLPEAHVEAPTAGSILLAGVLLKLGTYGILRFLIPVFDLATFYFIPLVYTLGILGIIYSCFTTIRQIDLKKIIAYSSVVHMNFVLLGLFTFNMQSLGGSLYLMLSHGIVSGGLFLCVGILYDRYHTRLLNYYSGIALIMPYYSIAFFILTFANIGFPGTGSFLGEFLIMLGLFKSNILVCIIGGVSIILSAAYGLWVLNRVLFYSVSSFFYKYSDLNKREFFLLVPLIFVSISSGIYSKPYFFIFNFFLYNII